MQTDDNEIPYSAMQPVSGSSTSTSEIPYAAFKPVMTDVATAPNPPQTIEEYPKTMSFLHGLGKAVTDTVSGAETDLAPPPGGYGEGTTARGISANIGAYFKNFHQLHETEDAGQITPAQREAAKVLGADLPYGGFWGPVYKMTPAQRQTLYNNAQIAAGVNPEEEAKKAQSQAMGEVPLPQQNVLLNLKSGGAAALLERLANPNLSRTLLRDRLNQVASAQSVLSSPAEHSAAEVKQAQAVIEAAKGESEHHWYSDLGTFAKTALTDPERAINQFGAGLEGDPELGKIPGLRLGEAAFSKQAGRAAINAAEATRQADIAGAAAAAAKSSPNFAAARAAREAAYRRVAERAAARSESLGRKITAGNIAGSAAVGAGVNTAISAEQQLRDQGFVKRGSLTGPAVTGAVLGGGLHTLSSGMDLAREFLHRAKPSPKVGPEGPTTPPPTTPEGAPLHPDTPVNDESNIPLTGINDVAGTHTHLDKSVPDTMKMKDRDGNEVSVPVKQAIIYHEHVEGPLLHVKGPVSEETIAELEQRIGRPLPELTKEKLRRGESLPYTNPDNPEDPGAHEIATWAENHFVHSILNVDPEGVYQPALKGIIDMAQNKAERSPGDGVPPTIDTKPSDDIGQTEDLGGQGQRPASDGVQPGAPEGSDNQSRGHNTLPRVSNEQLPPNLRGAKPTYYNGNRGWGLDFANDFDKAAYILRNPNKLSKHDAEYMRWAQRVSGMTPEAIRAHGQRVASTIKGQTANASPGRLKVGPHSQSGSVDKSLLAALAVSGLGAGAGALLAPQGHREAGAVAGGIGGLLLGINMLGDSIPTRGFGNKESGMFAGVGARTFRLKDAQFAEAMERAGKNDKEIQLATGMHRNAAGQWQFEISDEGMDVLSRHDPLWKEAQEHAIPLSRVVLHPQLDKAYPGLLDKIKIKIDPTLKSIGSFDPKTQTLTLRNHSDTGKYSLKSVIAHELQHTIQDIEGHPSGSNVRREVQPLVVVRSYLENRQETVYQKILAAERDGRPTAALEDQYDKIQEQLNGNFTRAGIEYRARGNYGASAGETQARNTQARLELTDEERRNTPIARESGGTEDVYRGDQIVRQNKFGTSAHEEPLSESLKKTGELDDEGRLHGMVLAEDKLPNEPEIVARAQSGDQQAFSQLYKQYKNRLVNSLRSYMRDAGPRLGISAEDVAQEAFIKAHQKLSSFRGDSSFYTWLYNIARNESLNEITRSNRQPQIDTMYNPSVGSGGDKTGTITGRESADTSGNPIKPSVEAAGAVEHTPEDMAHAQQVSNMVRYAIERLPPDIRTAIKLREMEGLSEQEIAQQEGVPVGTIKSRLSRGRDMLQQSIKRGHGANFRSQGGFSSFDQLKRLALLTGGGFLGYSLASPDHKVAGVIKGLAVGLATGSVTLAGVGRVWEAVKAADTDRQASVVLDSMQSSINISNRHLNALVGQIVQAVPDAGRRAMISHYLEGDKTIKLTPQEMQVAARIRSEFARIGIEALNAGVTKDLLPDYVTHIFSKDAKTQAALDAYQVAKITSAKQSSVFGKERKGPDTLAQAQAAGMTVETDIAKILQRYGTDMNHAIQGKSAIQALKKIDIGGNKILQSAKTAPSHFISNDHPALAGLKVHPAVAPELSHVFDVYRPGIIAASYDALANSVRRVKLSYSLFHALNLVQAETGVHLNPLRNAKEAIQAVFGKGQYHEAIKSPTPGDTIDRGLAAGLTGEFRSGASGNLDVGGEAHAFFMNVRDALNKTMPHLGDWTTPLFEKVDELTQKVTWQNTWTGLKASTEDVFFHRLKENNARRASIDPTHQMPTDSQLHAMASSVTNKIFGGLDYRRTANEINNKYGRQLLMELSSPSGMRTLKRSMLAPDFTIATMSHILGAFGDGGGKNWHDLVGGAEATLRPRTKADLHRSWILKSTLYYMVLGNALNYAMSGHYIWQNDKSIGPFMIDMGDGRKMVFSKVLTDPARMVQHPVQEAMNKTNPVIQEGLEQALNMDYLTPSAKNTPTIKDRLEHFAKLWEPIPAGVGTSMSEKAAGLMGIGIYGHKRKTQQQLIQERLSKMQEGK